MTLNDALKYTTDTVKTLLAELQKPEHNEHRWGADTSKQLRGFLADALRDAAADHTDRNQIESLHRQADLLSDPTQHIIIRDGRIRPAKFTEVHLTKALNDLHNVNQRMIGGRQIPDHILLSFWKHIGGEGEHPYGTFQVGGVDRDLNDRIPQDQKNLKVPASQLGEVLTTTELTRPSFKRAARLWNPEDVELFRGRFAAARDAIRKAPYEDVDTDHPSEQNNPTPH